MRIVCLLLLLLGLASSIFLMYRHLELATEEGSRQAGVCRTLLQSDCDGALQSRYSMLLGVPTAGWGVVYFGTLLALVGIGWFGQVFSVSESAIYGLVITLAGTAVGVLLTTVMLLGWVPFCPICLIAHVVNLNLIFVFKILTGKKWSEILKSGGWLIHRLNSNQPLSDRGAISLVSLFSVLLCGAIVFQWMLILQVKQPRQARDPLLSLASFATSLRFEIPVSAKDARLGRMAAEVQMVVFSDLQCAACQRFARELKDLTAAYPDRVSVVFKHFPLSSRCNRAARKDPHPRACEFAEMGENARRQGKFWEFHDAVFGEEQKVQLVDPQEVAARIGVDLRPLERSSCKNEIRERIHDDIELGLLLGVDETPAVFIGGRRSKDIRPETIHLLIMAELANRTLVPLSTLSNGAFPGERNHGDPVDPPEKSK